MPRHGEIACHSFPATSDIPRRRAEPLLTDRPWQETPVSETTAAPPAWSRTFPATPAQAREARGFLTGLLHGHPVTDDAVLCLSELVANAATHSDSRKSGGHFTVRAEMRGDC